VFSGNNSCGVSKNVLEMYFMHKKHWSKIMYCVMTVGVLYYVLILQYVMMTPSTEVQPRKSQKVLIFTIDSTIGYKRQLEHGGPKGEMVVRTGLEHVFTLMGVETDVQHTDEEFDHACTHLGDYALIIMDEWTCLTNTPEGVITIKLPLIGHQHKLFLLTFFGLPDTSIFGIPLQHALSAYPPTQSNTRPVHNDFLGFHVKEITRTFFHQRAGLVWGKLARYFHGKTALLCSIRAMNISLHSTLTTAEWDQLEPSARECLTNHYILPEEQWLDLLSSSSFMLGLGHPLLGPSAMEAVSTGAVFINPIYEKAEASHLSAGSQHPYLADVVGEPLVCSYHLGHIEQVLRCVEYALNFSRDGMASHIPDFTLEAHMKRVGDIFGKYIDSGSGISDIYGYE
jgi:hypothetical protein